MHSLNARSTTLLSIPYFDLFFLSCGKFWSKCELWCTYEDDTRVYILLPPRLIIIALLLFFIFYYCYTGYTSLLLLLLLLQIEPFPDGFDVPAAFVYAGVMAF